MRKKTNHKFVAAPYMVPLFHLPSYLATPLEHLFQAGDDGLTADQMQALGCKHPAKLISELKRRGVIIDAWSGTVFDEELGCDRKLTIYKYKGFLPTCDAVMTVHPMVKEMLCGR